MHEEHLTKSNSLMEYSRMKDKRRRSGATVCPRMLVVDLMGQLGQSKSRSITFRLCKWA